MQCPVHRQTFIPAYHLSCIPENPAPELSEKLLNGKLLSLILIGKIMINSIPIQDNKPHFTNMERLQMIDNKLFQVIYNNVNINTYDL